LTFPLTYVNPAGYDYVFHFAFIDEASPPNNYSHYISGKLYVEACGEENPSPYANKITNDVDYSPAATLGELKLNSVSLAPTNVNCTLSSYGFEETSTSGLLSYSDGCGLNYGQTDCLTISYPRN
jgi:hypothetical protein